MANMDAVLLYHEKQTFPDGAIAEIVVWRVPVPVPPSQHSFKYRLYFGFAGKRMIGYDNERGKGDHRHFGDREEPYRFDEPDRLIDDFWADIAQWRAAGSHSGGGS